MQSPNPLIVGTALVLIASTPAHPAQPAANAGRPVAAPAAKQSKPDAFRLTLGPGDQILIIADQRPGLAGRFRIRADGSVAIPQLGPIPAAGKTADELQTALGLEIIRRTKRKVSFSLEVEAWRPIYTVGDFERPGVYPFSPGMTVVHALASAGGFTRPLRGATPLDINRETTEYLRNTERLKTLLAEEARIIAELTDKTKIEVPGKLIRLAGIGEAKRIISIESKILRTNAQMRAVQFNNKQTEIKLTQNEISAFKKQRQDVLKRIQLVSAELANYNKLRSKGLGRSSRTLQLRSEVAALQGTSHTILASIARAEKALLTATEERDLIGVNHSIQLDGQLKTAQEQIKQIEGALSLHAALSQQLSTNQGPDTAERRTQAVYQIMRTINNRQRVLPARESTFLKPGDVVRVTSTIAVQPYQPTINGPRAPRK